MNKKLTVFKDEHFLVSQCAKCDIPGYLILEFKHNSKNLYQSPKAAQKQLGILIAKLEHIIEQTISPLNIYILKFGEETKSLHFHIFPRTTKITDEYLKEYPKQSISINGPKIFDWAREKYKVEFGNLSKYTFKILTLLKNKTTCY
jgi:diadenosine tetraphosphate (Ap4A) HIT family hydrolase